MHRTTVMLPEDLKRKAETRSRKLGISLGEFIRESLETSLHATPASVSDDPLFSDEAVFAGKAPPDLSSKHDDYLYGEKS